MHALLLRSLCPVLLSCACGSSGDRPPPLSFDPAPADAGSTADTGAVAPVQHHVTALAVDRSRNTLWVGTVDGLVRVALDDNTSERWTMDDVPLASNEIAALLVDDEGRLWIGYGYAFGQQASSNFCGLTVFDPSADTWRTYTKEQDSIIDDRVLSLALDREGRVHAGTYAAVAVEGTGFWGWYGDYHLCENPGTHCDKLWSWVAADMQFAEDGTLWVAVDLMQIGISGKPGGVGRRNPDGTSDSWDMADGLSTNQAKQIAAGPAGVFASNPMGIHVFDPATGAWSNLSDLQANDLIVVGDALLVATDANVHRLTPTGEQEPWTTPEGLPDPAVAKMIALDASVCFGAGRTVGCRSMQSGTWVVYDLP